MSSRTLALLLAMLVLPSIQVSGSPAVIAKVPAVYQTPEGVMKGSLSNLTVEVTSGTGKVYFSADPLTQLDTQGAARTAALVACNLLGVDPMSYNFYYSLESDSMIIGGPSAGAVMTVATIAAILGKQMRKDVIMTGMVNPDGTVGPVGGIPEKLKAAAEGGAKIFLIPAGQRKVVETIPKRKKIGPLVITTVETKTVDLIELGRSLGVEVKEVSTIAEAAKYFLGVEFPKPTVTNFEFPESIRDLLEGWVEHYLNASFHLRVKVEELLSSKGVDPISARAIKSVLKDSESLAMQARDQRKEGNLYTASSLAFQSAYEAEYAYWLTMYVRKGNKAVEELADKASSVVESVGKLVNSTKPDSLSGLEALVAAKVRYYTARNSLKQGAEMISRGDLLDGYDSWGAIHTLSYTIWRAETAKTWLWLLNVSKEGKVDQNRLRKVASTMIYEAEGVISYALSLATEVSSSSVLSDVNADLDMANSALSSGDSYGAIGLAAMSLAKATTTIHQLFTSDPLAALNAVKGVASSSIKKLLNKGVVPVLALSYYETASELELQKDVFGAITYYEMSSAHSQMLIMLSITKYKQPEKASGKTVTRSSPTTITETQTKTETVTKVLTKRAPEKLINYVMGAFLPLLVGLALGYLAGRRH